MGVLASEIKIFKTTNNLGGAITGNESLSGVAGDIFNTFSGQETTDGGTFYACVYIKNETVDVGNPVAQNVELYIDTETIHAGVVMALGLGTSAVNGVEQTIANENTAPAGVTFFVATDAEDVDDALIIGDIPDDQHKAVWIRITIDPATAAKAAYQLATKIKFESVE